MYKTLTAQIIHDTQTHREAALLNVF